MKQGLEALFLQLVQKRSVVSSAGETEIIDFIEEYLQGWDYFRRNPANLVRVMSKNDPLGRSSLLVCVSGQEASETVVLLGHTDTVEVDDYGLLQDLATSPSELMEALKDGARDLSPQGKEDLDEDAYYWGRGTLDMKAGVANELHLLKKLSENRDKFKGHVVALFVCDEEGNSAGMIAAIGALQKWRDSNDAEILGVINTDYHTAQYPGDKYYYLFRGTVGKIMPAFYVRTIETHAGDPFAGLDANMVLADLAREINLNPKYSDGEGDEISVPPITLKMTDLKDVYSVKTNHEAWTLISVPLFGQSPADVMNKMESAARGSAAETVDRFYRYQETYNEKAGIPAGNAFPEFEIITLARLVERSAEVLQLEPAALLDKYLGPSSDISKISDTREQTLQLMRQLELLLPDRRPRIVIGFAPPFYPAISYAQYETSFYDRVDQGLRAATEALAKTELPAESGVAEKSVKVVAETDARATLTNQSSEGDTPAKNLDHFQSDKTDSCEADIGTDVSEDEYRLEGDKVLKVKTFYPYISDLSYLALPYSDDELEILQDNMPTLGRNYNVPLETMRDLNCPVINLGAYGYDAHKWTERVERDYSFVVLPRLLEGIVKELLGN